MCEHCENRTTTSGYNMKLHSIYIDPTIEHKKIKNKYMPIEQLKKEEIFDMKRMLQVNKICWGNDEPSIKAGKIHSLIRLLLNKSYLAGKKEAIEELKKK